MTLRLLAIALLSILTLGLAACSGDDEEAQTTRVATLVSGQRAEIRLGGVTISIPGESIGSDTDQLPNGSRVTLAVRSDLAQVAAVKTALPNAKRMGPSYSIGVRGPDGTDLSNRQVASPYRITLTPDGSLLAAADLTAAQTRILKLSGTTVSSFPFAATPVVNTSFSLDASGWPTVEVNTLSDFALIDPGTGTSNPNPSVALTGTLQTVAGVSVLNLAPATGTDTVVVTFPSTATGTIPATITANPTTLNTANPTDPNNRTVILTSGGTQFTSFATGGTATVTVASLTGTTATGTITGTLAAAAGGTRTVNYTFTTAAGAGAKTLGVNGTQFAIKAAATDAVASTGAFNGTDWVAIWAGPVGTNTRTLFTRKVTTAGAMTGTEQSITPTVDFVAPRLAAAFGGSGTAARILVVGASANDTTGAVVGTLLNGDGQALGTPINMTIATSAAAPRVAYNAAANLFAVAFNRASGGVGVVLISLDGVVGGTVISATATAGEALSGLAGATGATAEFLVTYSNGTGVRARRINATNGNLGSEISVVATGSGGACAFERVGGAWIVSYSSGGARTLVRIAPGSDTLGSTAALAQLSAPLELVAGAQGLISMDRNTIPPTTIIESFQGADSNATAPVVMATPISPALTGNVTATFNTVTALPALIADGTNGFLLIGVSSTGGVTAIRLRITSGT